MWYATLPTFIIITAAICFPNMYAYFSNKLFLGQPYRRVITDRESPYLFLRDARLSDQLWAYDYKGLDNIPDTEASKN